jgi:hypothetical protein
VHLLRHLLRRVETTPTQDRAIEEAFAELTRSAKPLRGEAKQSRADLAAAMRRTSLDEVALGEMFARHDRLAEDLRKALVGFLARVHEILDDIQRERFAALLEKGGLGGAGFTADGSGRGAWPGASPGGSPGASDDGWASRDGWGGQL